MPLCELIYNIKYLIYPSTAVASSRVTSLSGGPSINTVYTDCSPSGINDGPVSFLNRNNWKCNTSSWAVKKYKDTLLTEAI